MENYGLAHTDFLKIDCEGAEYSILSEAAPSTLEKVKTISLEFHDLKRSDTSALSLITTLRRRGFAVAKLAYEGTMDNTNFGKLVLTQIESN